MGCSERRLAFNGGCNFRARYLLTRQTARGVRTTREGICTPLTRPGASDQPSRVKDILSPLNQDELLQLREFGLRVFQDGYVGIGVFPERKKLLIGRLGL
jgi:hypothetical protein